MTSGVVELPVVTRIDRPAERVLQGAIETGMSTAVVVGWTAEGEFYFSSSAADGAAVLWLMEIAKKRILIEGGA